MPADDYPVLLFEDAGVWSRWLESSHATASGVWLRLRKKGSAIQSVTYLEALEVALCYGWIDGQTRKFDEGTYLQKFTPRRKGSIWSQINRDRVLALENAGRMKQAGLLEVDKAKANGQWDRAYSSAIPPELESALAANDKALRFYRTLDGQNRMALHFRIQTLRRPESRHRKAAEFVAMLAEGKKLI